MRVCVCVCVCELDVVHVCTCVCVVQCVSECVHVYWWYKCRLIIGPVNSTTMLISPNVNIKVAIRVERQQYPCEHPAGSGLL